MAFSGRISYLIIINNVSEIREFAYLGKKENITEILLLKFLNFLSRKINSFET